MRQVKIFKGIETELTVLENEINSWVRDHAVEVVSVTGNIAPQTSSVGGHSRGFSASDVLVIVVYVSKSAAK